MKSTQIEFVIFSLNECNLLAEAAESLRGFGLTVSVFADSRTRPEELEILRDRQIPFRVVDNSAAIPEGMFVPMFKQVKSEWAFLLNVDEWPSPELVESVIREVSQVPDTVNVMGIPRKWLRFSDSGRLEYSRFPMLWKGDYQWRVLRHRNLTYRAVIHTPGFVLDPSASIKLPRGNTIFHFDWIVHSLNTRKRKLRRYFQLSPPSARRFADIYLPENRPWAHFFKGLKNDEVVAIARRLQAASSDGSWVDE